MMLFKHPLNREPPERTTPDFLALSTGLSPSCLAHARDPASRKVPIKIFTPAPPINHLIGIQNP